MACAYPYICSAESPSEQEDLKNQAAILVNASAAKAQTKIDQKAVSDLAGLVFGANNATKMAIVKDPSSVESSLGEYMRLKAKFKFREHGELKASDLNDFDWDAFLKYKSFQAIAAGERAFYITKSTANNLPQTKRIEVGGVDRGIYLLPTNGKQAAASGVDFSGNPFSVTLTGSASDVPLNVKMLSSDLCEIDVSSDPSEADVYFDGKLYYQKTAVHSTRPAKEWRVTVKKDHYAEYEETKAVAPHETWVVNAILTKNP